MRRRKTAIFFAILGIALTMLAAALNIGWILLNLREVALLVFGVVFFAIIITGLILNTIFLVREIRRNEQHDAFLNAVTHELKTPIASIKLYLETLKGRDLPPEKRREFYDIMLADNERLLGTVEQVLQAGRAREKHRAMDLTQVDIAELVQESIATIISRQHLDESCIRLSTPSAPVSVLGDRRELQTAVSNLLENAVKYADVEPRVSVRIKATRGTRVEIYIRDNGIGISRADLKQIFKRFYRAKPAATKGTGLGLAIVRSIATKHGGRVYAESKGEGKGSTFVLELPLG